MRVIKLYIISFIALTLSSCNALDLGSIDNYSLDNYWKTEEQCDRFITGLHGRIRGQMENFLLMGEMRGGLLSPEVNTTVGQNAHNVPIVSNSLTNSSPGISTWGGFYGDIYQINHAIDRISTACEFLSPAKRNQYLGQLYGMRAYYYFHMLRTWGGVPLCDFPDVLVTGNLVTLNKAKSSESEIFQFIKDDVNRSKEAFKDMGFTRINKSASYWNKAASYCLYAEVYLWGVKVKPIGSQVVYSTDIPGDLNLAKQALSEVKTAATPHASFADVFKIKENPEIFFAFHYQNGEKANIFGLFTYPSTTFSEYEDAEGKPLVDPINVNGGALRYEWKRGLFDGLNDKDSRKKATFFDFYKRDKLTGEIIIRGMFLNKFIGTVDKGLRYYDNDWPIYRYMDAVLLLAEVSNELDDKAAVKSYIEEVRTRAFGVKDLPTFTYTTKVAAEEAILAERDIEFVGEGKRWYDVRRMLGGRIALDLVKKDELLLLWPIDSGVLSTDSNVKQNDGYLK